MQSTCGLSIAARTRSVGLLVERRVERGDDPVELGEHLVGDVERRRPRGCSPRSRAGSRNGVSCSLSSLDLLPLRLEPAVAEVVRVVGDAEELVAARLRGARHLLDRRSCRPPTRSSGSAARRAGRRSSTSVGQLAVPRRLELAGVLAQLRRDRARSRGTRRAPPRSRCVTTSPVSTAVTPYSEIESPRRCASSRSATLWSFEPVKCWSRLP